MRCMRYFESIRVLWHMPTKTPGMRIIRPRKANLSISWISSICWLPLICMKKSSVAICLNSLTQQQTLSHMTKFLLSTRHSSKSETNALLEKKTKFIFVTVCAIYKGLRQSRTHIDRVKGGNFVPSNGTLILTEWVNRHVYFQKLPSNRQRSSRKKRVPDCLGGGQWQVRTGYEAVLVTKTNLSPLFLQSALCQ